MACRANHLGSIVNASRETLDEGKVKEHHVALNISDDRDGFKPYRGQHATRRHMNERKAAFNIANLPCKRQQC